MLQLVVGTARGVVSRIQAPRVFIMDDAMPDTHPVQRVQPIGGFCPCLKPCQVCQDEFDRLFHCRTPDNLTFAVEPNPRQGLEFPWMRIVGNKLSIEPSSPEYASCGRGPATNVWTIRNGRWVRDQN